MPIDSKVGNTYTGVANAPLTELPPVTQATFQANAQAGLPPVTNAAQPPDGGLSTDPVAEQIAYILQSDGTPLASAPVGGPFVASIQTTADTATAQMFGTGVVLLPPV